MRIERPPSSVRATRPSLIAPARGRARGRGFALGVAFAVGLVFVSAFAFAACLDPRFDATPAPAGRCTRCHGSEERAGSDADKAAPPSDVLGKVDPSVRAVGAHQIHLEPSSTHAAVACSECHTVPDEPNSPGHAEGAGVANIVFGKLARRSGRVPKYDREKATCADTYCHIDARPVWNAPRASTDTCGTCHTLPPLPPHVQVPRAGCPACHVDVDAQGQVTQPALHVNGQLDLKTSSP